MALEGFQPFVLRTFGGLCTSIDRLSLGVGMSPNCTNVRFDPGTVGSRYGYYPTSSFGANWVSSTYPIYGFSSFVTRSGARHALYVNSYGAPAGILYDHTSDTAYTALSNITTKAVVTTKLDSLFGVAYLALPYALPRQATKVAGTGTGAILDAWGTTRLIGLRDKGAVELAVFEPSPGEPAWVTDTNPASPYHAEVTVAAGAGGLAVGVHMYTWLFLTDTGYITKPGMGGSFTVAADATSKLDIYNAPIGPPGTAARILALTAAGDSNFFWVPNKTIIWDNTTKNLSITVAEEEVYLGEPVRTYMTQYTPAAPAGVVAYSNRLVLWGGLDKAETSIFTYPTFSYIGLPNLAFDGGFQTSTNQYYTSATNTLPAAWVPTAAGYVGFGPGTTGTTLKITNPTLSHGCSVTNTFDGTYIRSKQMLGIRARVRVSRVWTLAADGQITITVTLEASGGGTVHTATLVIDSAYCAAAGTGYGFLEYGPFEVPSLGVPPASAYSATIEVKCTQAYSAPADFVEIDWIEFFDGSSEWGDTLRVSRAADPESFDSATGLMLVAPDDGEGIRACFKLRDSLFICKDTSLYATRDTGEEPVSWPVDLVSRIAGTPSLHGVGIGDGWVIILSRVGVILFDGAAPQVISQEISDIWNTVDWANGVPPWVTVDVGRKLIRIGIPTNASFPRIDKMLVLDYVEGFGNPVPSGQGRKWSIDTLDAKTGTTPEFHHGVSYVVNGAGNSSGADKVATAPVYSMSMTRDAGNTINTLVYLSSSSTQDFAQEFGPNPLTNGKILSVYETAPIGPEIGRATFDKVVQRTRGAETITVQFVKPDNSVISVGAGTAAMTATPEYDIELGSNTYATSLGIRLSTTVLNGWFALRRLAVFLKDSTYGFTRGKTDHTSA